MNKKIVAVEGKKLSLSNLEKVLYPSSGFTKAEVLEYYRRISKFILPHLEGRALTLKRYPDGVGEEFFFEKRCPSHRPPWVKTADIRQHDGTRMTVCLVNDLNTLVWVENLASLELHVPLGKAASQDTPDSMVFDLDPGEGADATDCAKVALLLKELLGKSRLRGYVKTSGMKGLHLFVPLNNKETTFEQTKKFSRAAGEVLQRKYPDLVTTNMAKTNRRKKVFINWSQNDPAKTMVCVYSLRASEEPRVSFPLQWKELEALAGRGDPEKFQITHAAAVKRLEKDGDLFRDVLIKKQKLPYV